MLAPFSTTLIIRTKDEINIENEILAIEQRSAFLPLSPPAADPMLECPKFLLRKKLVGPPGFEPGTYRL